MLLQPNAYAYYMSKAQRIGMHARPGTLVCMYSRHAMRKSQLLVARSRALPPLSPFTVQERYGGSTVIHWEDVGVSHAFELLDRLQSRVRASTKIAKQLLIHYPFV